MQVGLIVDSACELPDWYIKENDIFLLPSTILIDGQEFVDTHDPDSTLEFYRSGLLERGHEADTRPYSVDQIRSLFLEEVVTRYDFVMCQTISRTLSPNYENASAAMNRIMTDYRSYRKAAGLDSPFSMRVISSRHMFVGQGVLAAHTMNLIRHGIPKNELRQQVSTLIESVYGYAIPRDPGYLRKRTLRYGNTGISSVAALLGKTLNITPIGGFRDDNLFWGGTVRGFDNAVEKLFGYAAERIRKGVASPYVCISYGGDPADLDGMPGYDHLKLVAKENGVELLVKMMSITCAIYMGRGAITLALAAPKHRFVV